MKSNISNIIIDNTNENLIDKKFIDFLVKLETLNYLKKENLIDIDLYDKAIVYLKKSYISK